MQPDLFLLHNNVLTEEPEVSVCSANPAAVRLVIEALSSSTARHDRVVKLARYRRQRIDYWIMDHEAGVIERWVPDAEQPEILAQTLTWRVADVEEHLVLDLERLFRGLNRARYRGTDQA